MSLLPKSQQYRDDILCWPLGAAKVKPVAVKVDPISAFNMGDHCGLWVTEYDYEMIQEEDCRQIKGAAQETDRPSGEASTAQARRSPVAAPPSPATPVAVPTFMTGDRVQIVSDADKPYLATVLGQVETGLFAGAWHIQADDSDMPGIALESEMVLLPSEPKEADGWIAHRPGDPCPVGPEVIVHCKNRTGHPSPCAPTPARTWAWDYVTAYRLVKQQ